jgi:predicted DNA-binding transcriptional regulator AlpA
MSPTEIFSSNGEEISKTAQVSIQNAHNSFPNAQIDAFHGKMTTGQGSGGIPPKNRFYLQNLDGRTAHGAEKELLVVTGLSRQLFYQLKTGRTEYAKRWKIESYEENGVKQHIQQRGTKRKYILFFRDRGVVLKKTKIEFSRMTGMDRNQVYHRISKKLPIPGWQYYSDNLKLIK